LTRSREELEQLVAERTRSLAAANDRLTAEMAERHRTEEALRQSQKLEAIGQLTSGVAHDFNNLLTGIVGNLELLEGRLRSAESLRRLRSAREAAERGARLTHQLLAFSRKQRLAGCGKMQCVRRILGNSYAELTLQLSETAMQTGFCSDFAGFCGVWADSGHGYPAAPTSLGSRTRL
jgi:C4-dicarboxylate-specific signal transduction histidine kinase